MAGLLVPTRALSRPHRSHRPDRPDRPEWTESVEWADHAEEEAADREERMEWLEREGRLVVPSRARAGSVRDEVRNHARNQARNQWSVVRGESEPVELGDLRAAGLVRPATEPAGVGVDQVLPIAAPLRPLFPSGGLRRGGTVALTVPNRSRATAATGSTSLLFALLAEATAAGSWCAVVGLPDLGVVAAAEAGVAIDRLALVAHPGPEWVPVVGALLDGLDLVVTVVPEQVSATLAGRLAARARQRGAVLLPVGGRWPGADLTLEVVAGAWHGLASGRGRLRRYEAEVTAYGRGAAVRPRRARLWLSGPVARSGATPMVLANDSAPVLRLAG